MSRDNFELADRLEAMDESDPKAKRPRRRDRPSLRQALGPALALAGIGAVLAFVAQRPDAEEPLAVAEAEPWQGTGAGFEPMPTPAAAPIAPAIPAPTPAVVQPAPTGPSATEQALLDRLAGMEAQLDAMREAATAAPQGDGEAEAQIEALSDELNALRNETDRLRDEAEDAERRAREQAAMVRALEGQLAAQPLVQDAQFTEPGASAPAAGLTEAERLKALEERRAAAEELRQARIASPVIAFGGSAAPARAEPGTAPDLGPDEAFLRDGARAAVVEQATVIADPSRTVVQGTVIQAAMETALDSSLPGAIRAVVSEDVHSFDGSRVLIPRGSKLIGRYNSALEPTQRRVLIAWDRIVTPDGQSVTISAYGADELGRSGTTGRIDRRLGTRFGSAALVSLISAVPQIAGAAVDDPLAADVAVDLGEDAEGAASSALEPFLTVPPTIHVDQGARITVLVDRDLELS